jgi:hypothetical protein
LFLEREAAEAMIRQVREDEPDLADLLLELSSSGHGTLGADLAVELCELVSHAFVVRILREYALKIPTGHALLPLASVVLSPLGQCEVSDRRRP